MFICSGNLSESGSVISPSFKDQVYLIARSVTLYLPSKYVPIESSGPYLGPGPDIRVPALNGGILQICLYNMLLPA